MPSFLNPALLSLIPLASIPIIIHLIHRRRFKIIYWSAMEFLLLAESRSTRRRRIQNLILLILRTLILLFIILASARPLLKTSEFAGLAAKQNTHAILILDDSFSMSYSLGKITLFDRVKETAREIISLLKPGDAVSIILASEPARVVGTPQYNLQNVIRDIQNFKVSAKKTDYISALLLAKEEIRQTTLPRKEIYLIGDCQAVGFRKYSGNPLLDISERVKMYVIKIAPEDISNAAIVKVEFPKPLIDTLSPTRILVSISNFSKVDLHYLHVEMYINDNLIEKKPVSLKANSTEIIEFHHYFDKPGKYHGYMQLVSDSLDIDNKFYFTVDVKEEIKVLAVDGEISSTDEEGACKYFQIAVNPLEKGPIKLKVLPYNSFVPFIDKIVDYDAVVLANVPQLPLSSLPKIEKYIRTGGSLFISLGDLVDPVTFNSAKILPARIINTHGDEKLRAERFFITSVNTNHYSMKIFGEPELLQLKQTPFYKYYKLDYDKSDADVSILCSFQDGSPLLIERKLGNGKIIMYTTSLDDKWTIFPRLGVMYVPLMQQMISYITSKKKEEIYIPNPIIKSISFRDCDKFGIRTSPPLIINPQKEETNTVLSPYEDGYVIKYDKTEIPGIYTLQSVDRNIIDKFSVNVDYEESNLENYDEWKLRSIFQNVNFSFYPNEKDIRTKLIQERVGIELWKTLIYLSFIFGICEMILAHKWTRR